MEPSLAALIAALPSCECFEDAAAAGVHPILSLASSAIAASTLGGKARALRGMVHVRPEGGYHKLAIVGGRERSTGEPWCAPSTTAWRWVTAHAQPIAVDVLLGTLALPLQGGAPIATDEDHFLDSQESRTRLLGRDATHLLVLPLRAQGGAVAGMISIEAECRAATGKEFLWKEIAAGAQLLADAAALHLLALPSRTPATDALLPVIGESMAGVVQVLRVFARQEDTILLSGPTGAGKSRLARWCHEQSRRRGERFETLDLATVPEELQMAELFGWRKGAFSGAIKDTPGAIARVEAGTLFIDEIDKLSLKAQAGLLHVLEERRYRPLGEGAGDRDADVRFVVGTNTNLPAEVRGGRFREDLYYRIHVLPVRVKPLAERRDEIPRWAVHMLERRHGATAPGSAALLSPGAERALQRYDWPGNLRQLDNIVRRAYALALMAHAAPPLCVTLDAHHVETALAYEGAALDAPGSVIDAYRLAAAAFVREAERRPQGEPLDLDLADAIRGFVLAAAIEATGSRDEAFRLFGKASMVQNRNHQKALRRELERADALCRALGSPPMSGRLLEGDEKP